MAEISLSDSSVPARRNLHGSQTFSLDAGDDLKLEAGVEEKLNVTVPASKEWSVTIQVSIEETDV